MESMSTSRISPEERLLSLLEAAWTVTMSYEHTPMREVQLMVLDLYDLTEEALVEGWDFPEHRKVELARAVLGVELLIFEKCASAPLALALKLVQEEGVRRIVDEHNVHSGPADQFVLFRHQSPFSSPLDGMLLLMTTHAKEKHERFVDEWFIAQLGELARLQAVERLLCGLNIDWPDLN